MAPEAETLRHERPAIDTRRVLAMAGGFLALVILMGGLLGLYYRSIIGGARLATRLHDFPAPRLQPNPAQDERDFMTAQRKQLEGYAWVDRDKGLIHVPIERAMALVAARGAQAYDPVQGTPPFTAGAPLDGLPRARPNPDVAPYGEAR